MPYAERNGTRLYYNDGGSGKPALLFVHGWCCDMSYWQPQIKDFRRRHRVVAVDLRGHGRSDKPQQAYTMDGFCADLEWLMGKLDLRKPVVIGHSMGGNIALRLAGRRKRALSGIIMVDSPIFPKFTADGRRELQAIMAGFESPAYGDVARAVVDANMFRPTSPAALRKRIGEAMARAPQHVMASAFRELWADNAALAKRVTVPSLFIDSGRPFEELQRIATAVPGIDIARTAGAGHFLQLEVPDQCTAMLQTFIDQVSSIC